MRTIPVGVGYYTRAEAARLLNLSPSRVRRWVSGYTFWLEGKGLERKRRMDPVVETDLPPIGGSIVLSFVELMELRVVKAFLNKGLSLQRVREAAALAQKTFCTDHPFASRRVFTDGRNIFIALSQEAGIPNLLELTRGRYLQIQSGQLLEEYLDEIEFSEDTALAHRWWPLSRRVPIVLDPQICFGAPVVEGTAIRTDVISSIVRASSESEAAESYGLRTDEVMAALRFEEILFAA